jgi:hypothetical protein
MIYTAPCVRFLMCADRLHGEVGGLALEIESFVGPCEIARADRRVLFGFIKNKSVTNWQLEIGDMSTDLTGQRATLQPNTSMTYYK